MMLIFAALYSFLGLVIGESQTECPTQMTSTFYPANNRVFRNHVFQEQEKLSDVICGRECAMESKCASFNYHAETKLCQVSNTTRSQHPRDFVNLQGWVYFDKNLNTISFSTYESTYMSCQELLTAGYRDNGIYTIYPAGLTGGLQVYCDMETDQGGWIVFQRRQDGSFGFYRRWGEYKHGFGDLAGEFWLGNEALRILTQTGQWQLRVDLWDWENNTAWAEYGKFAISGGKYTLHIGSYNASGTAGDAMASHNTHYFTTKDRDNDINQYNCARQFVGAWWFTNCLASHLNGKYYHRGNVDNAKGIHWRSWKGSMKRCNMKIRQVA